MITNTRELVLNATVKTYWKDEDMEGRYFTGGTVLEILDDREFVVAINGDPTSTEIINISDFDVKIIAE